MAKFEVVDLENKKIGSLELPDAVFAAKVNQPLVLQAIKAYLAGRRQGTAATKTKGFVRGGGKKPFKQKGTGNARQGSSRSPLNPGGGSNFGPSPRSYLQATPKEMNRGALRSVLSDKAEAKCLVILENIVLSSSKTQEFSNILKKFKVKSALFVDVDNSFLKLATRNIPSGGYLNTDGTNVYDLVRHEWLFLSKASAKALADRLSK